MRFVAKRSQYKSLPYMQSHVNTLDIFSPSEGLVMHLCHRFPGQGRRSLFLNETPLRHASFSLLPVSIDPDETYRDSICSADRACLTSRGTLRQTASVKLKASMHAVDGGVKRDSLLLDNADEISSSMF
jgi:hypothetical protein